MLGNILDRVKVECGASLNNVIHRHCGPQKFKNDSLPGRYLIRTEEKQMGSIFFVATNRAEWCFSYLEIMQQASGWDGLIDKSVNDVSLYESQG